MDALTAVLAALADPTRRDIVGRLAGGDATAGELAAPYAITPQAVSKHLRVLEEAGLVSRRREAQRRPVHLEVERLDLLTMWIERQRRTAVLRAAEGAAEDAPDITPAEAEADRTRSTLHGGADRVFQPWDLGARRVPPDA
ncbi:ArsR/SmtB family transcription factor [Cellulomonas denverensis]|uniref:ArsR/SmtB family transcription factor n=1 Tax=Cellulomonas denverensis TaxID=264297 RepID=UPI001943671C|nr:metalloregulator ArsR/SmtB family transcription factor [Cellulomonas denverensis]GIG23955.1 hypothetical protein Cde04nite_01990 [Cellulomonas denverensis]